MARAKRTNRAEARRRYRAQAAEGAAAEGPDSPTARPVDPAPRGPRSAPEPQRAGMRYAFRAAIHPPNLRDDLAHIDEILGSRALWASVGIAVASAVVLIATSGSDFISRVVAQYFLLPPPIIAIFVAGFFARRASYVSGLIVAIVAALALQAVLALNPASLGLVVTANAGTPGPSASPGASPSASPSPSPSPSPTAAPSASGSAAASAGASAAASANPSPSPTPQPVTEEMVSAAKKQLTNDSFTTIPMSVLFASAAAWYRRFLRLGNPNRAPARGAGRGKPNNRRR